MNWTRTLLTFFCCFCLCVNLAGSQDPPSSDDDRQKLLSLFSGEWVSRGLYVATKLQIADHLQSEPLSIEAIAHLANSDPESLYRLLHMLAGFGVFEEIEDKIFTNTSASLLLSHSHPNSLHAMGTFYGEDIHRALDEFLPCIRQGRPAFEFAFQEPVFCYFKANPERAALFQKAMKEKSKAVIQSILNTLDFSPYHSVYDIGGGSGQFLTALLEKHPSASGTLFELPEVIEKIEAGASFSLHAGDFFDAVPKGGDVYLLKSVLHDWNDTQAKTILHNLSKAMGPKSRLLIVEVALRPKDLSIYANCMDILMLAITGGKERSLSEFKSLLHAARLKLEKVHATTTEFSILEIVKPQTR